MVLEKKKQLKGEQHNNIGIAEEDRVSELSDSLLLHILSFLPIKCVVSTSILSRRWRYIWTSIQILDFRSRWSPAGYIDKSCELKLETKSFMNFVDKVLTLHDIPSITKFALVVDDNFDEFRVNAWITTLIKRKIENLILSVQKSESYLFPSCFFTCESLTELDLDMDNVLNLPKSVSFPRLKILHLTNIIFVDQNLTQQFFTNCPILEELKLYYCIWEDMNFFCISAPTLKHFSIWHPDVPSTFTTVKIYAPNLLSLVYNEIVPKNFVIHSFPSLVKAYIDFIYEDAPLDVRVQTAYASTKLLEKIYNVKKLRMSRETFEVLSYAVVPLTKLPAFGNLIRLKVVWGLNISNIRTFFDFLQISPIIESLVFIDNWGDDRKLFDADDVWTLNLVPQCLLLHLKSVEFCSFRGCPGELEMVKLLLKNSGVLQMMTIKCSFGVELKEKNEVMEQLLMFPRGSVNCVVKYSSEL